MVGPQDSAEASGGVAAGLLEFPCVIAIKAMGLDAPEFDATVVDVVRRHVGPLAEDAVSRRVSAQGTYVSVTVTVAAESRAQLDAIYRELTAHERVMMVL